MEHLRIEERDNITIVVFLTTELQGEKTIRSIQEELIRLIEKDGKNMIVLDMTGLTYLASMALAMLIAIYKSLNGIKGKLAISQPTNKVAMQVLTVTKMNKIFPIEKDPEAAILALAS